MENSTKTPPTDKIYFNYWGKSKRANDSGKPLHLLPFHSLDVAAVGMRLFDNHPRLRALLGQGTDGNEPALRQWLGFFLAIHDLGKFSNGFQNLNPDARHHLNQTVTDDEYKLRHDTLGFILWHESIGDFICEGGWLGKELSQQDNWYEFFSPLAEAVLCHHGVPADMPCYGLYLSHYFSDDNERAAQQFVADCAQLFLKEEAHNLHIDLELLYGNNYPQLLSWWFAGAAVLCDWIGSNQDYFDYHDTPQPLETYWNHTALPQAAKAFSASGIKPASARGKQTATDLFAYLKDPTPLQTQALQTVQTLTQNDSAQLFLLEDVTGAGKTEAAFLLLNGLMAAGLADGFYIALPTMATANAMFERSREVYQRLFQDPENTSLILAHGAASMNRKFSDSIVPIATTGDANYQPQEHSATSHCSQWLADNHKKALLAQAGIGTIDQALMSVLQNRHQSLRLLGLLGKVLVVDEVHAADQYAHTLLCTLLRLHALAGGSVILMSATLPMAMRRELVNAFQQGLHPHPENLPQPQSRDYPLLTHLSAQDLIETRVEPRPLSRRELSFKLIHSEEAVYTWILKQLKDGHCVCWVRNTVADAINAQTRLLEHLNPDNITLFHARFALVDRLRIEQDIVSRFGNDTDDPSHRHGHLVIATQVIQESLDLDFDFMVSDLAPIDLLLQRAGRLRRHSRDKNGALSHSDQRGDPTLQVLSPPVDQTATEHWLDALLKNTQYVYPDLGKLWLTVSLIQQHGTLCIPEHQRDWIESVYGPAHTPIPTALLTAQAKLESELNAARSIAKFNTIKPTNGYAMGNNTNSWAQSHTPTRLSEDPSQSLLLARWQDGKLSPWAQDKESPWSMSRINIRLAALKEINISEAACSEAINQLTQDWTYPPLIVPLSADSAENQCATGKDAKGNHVQIRYHPDLGLELERL